MKRILSLCIVCLIFISTTVFAEVDTTEIDAISKSVSIKGSVAADAQGIDVFIEVLNAEGNTVFVGVNKTTVNGKFEFNFKLPNINTVYTTHIKSNFEAKAMEKELVVVEDSVKRRAEQLVINSSSATVGNVLVQNIDELQVKVYQALDLDIDLYMGLIDKNDVNNALADLTDASKITEVFSKACTASKISQATDGKREMLENNFSVLGLDQTEGYVAYNSTSIGALAKDSMIGNLKLKYSSMKSDFNNWVADIILKKVNYTQLFELVNCMPVTFSTNSLPNFQAEGVTAEAVAKIVLQNGVSLGNFHSKVREAVAEIKNNSGNSESPGYSGGGGSSNSSGNIALNTPQLPPQLADGDGLVFPDMVGFDWAISDVEKLYKLGIIKGDATGRFRPNDSISREEFTAMIVRTLGSELSQSPVSFADCVEGEWYVPYVSTAFELGIVQGVSSDEFGVGRSITREDIAVILHRVAVSKGVPFKSKHRLFLDSENISEYAKEAVGILGKAGVINGTPEGSFNPKNVATRAEAAKMISAIYDKIQDAAEYEE